ncbi:MAG: hypothetical protein IKX22_05080 [Prevotella sp.]|nr:hypothetical protein [Prevotella sp.]
MGKRKTIWCLIEALLFLLLGIGYAKLEEKTFYFTYSSREVQEIRDANKFRELHRTAPLRVDSIDGVLKYESYPSCLFQDKTSLHSDKVLLNGELMKDNVVENKLMALVIAEAAWYPIYREDCIRDCAPYLVDEDEIYYYIDHDINPRMEYDEENQQLRLWDFFINSPEIIIRKSDGKIVYICFSI